MRRGRWRCVTRGLRPRAAMATVAVMLAASTLLAHVEIAAQSPGAVERVVIDVRTAWASAVAAYRAKPTADRISVSVRDESRGTRRDEYTVRLSPAEGERPESMLLELGSLRVFASQGQVLAWLDGVRTTYWRATYEGELDVVTLSRLIPPVSLPQLTALRGGEDVGVVTMFAPDAAWTAAAITGLDDEARVRVDGRAGDMAAQMILMPTGRFVSLSVTIAPGTIVDLKMTPIEPGDPAEWKPDLTGRQRVETLAELRPRAGDAGKNAGKDAGKNGSASGGAGR